VAKELRDRLAGDFQFYRSAAALNVHRRRLSHCVRQPLPSAVARGNRSPMTEAASDPAKPAPRVSFVSLGCPKALVDSERILTRLRAEGYELSKSHAGADAVIVNTCGFLDSAKKESLEAIGAAMAENGKVIVTGCMGAESDAIRDACPNVAAITGPQAYESVMAAVRAAAPAPSTPSP
jgi:ribosomal protein S12 methylthiotransferase